MVTARQTPPSTNAPDLPPSRSWQFMKDKQCSRPAVSIIIVSEVFKPVRARLITTVSTSE
jgi:hypothetical protein